MCGITGFFSFNPDGWRDSEKLLQRMTDRIVHRGPDDAGTWVSDGGQVGLGHRRLSIVDLSPAGHQPMHSVSGRYVLVFNGEIYNHLGLRQLLESQGSIHSWRGHSDTETLLAGFDAWGIESTIQRAVGMFAMAIWDRQLQSLTLIRDRIGEKPLYYGWLGDVLVFASELKALTAHPLWQGEIDRSALALYLRFNYIPAPQSIYQGISKLMPGVMLTVSIGNRALKIKPYWSVIEAALSGLRHPFQGGEHEAVNMLESLLSGAISQQMMSDVPLGAFLSGGVDSSTIVALMQAQSNRPIKTFTIGFQEKGFDEAVYAKSVAQHLGTDHTELYVSAAQAMEIIPQLPFLYDEPFADSSQIPTFLVSKLARDHVTVSLSGDAGDELFCGYNRYVIGHRWSDKLRRIPNPIRKAMASAIRHASPDSWNRVASMLPNSLNRYAQLGDKLHKGALLLDGNSGDIYASLVSLWPDTSQLVKDGHEPETIVHRNEFAQAGLGGTEQMMLLDTLTYLPDDILAKVDRAAMGVSLETRVPFLDHRVVEFAWKLPFTMKLHNGTTKWALREVLYKHVPKALIERPKMGFGIPVGDWLRGPLKDWAESLLDADRLEREGYFYPSPIREKWEQHLSGRYNWSYQLWGVLMFQAWLDASYASQ